MDVLAIELNDAGIRAARSNESQLLAVDGEHRSSPGLALLRTHATETGMAAARQSAQTSAGGQQPVLGSAGHSADRSEELPVVESSRGGLRAVEAALRTDKAP